MKRDTLDVSWIKEEEVLISMTSIPPKEVLKSIPLQFVFVNSESEIVWVIQRTQSLDISGNQSVLPKETILKHIQTAKEEYASSGSASGTAVSFMDMLIWNAGIEPDHIHRYAEFDDPGRLGTEFIRGSIFYDTLLDPSMFIFHSNQCIFLFFRESVSHKGILFGQGHLSQGTKRVRFAAPQPSVDAGKRPYASRSTRKIW